MEKGFHVEVLQSRNRINLSLGYLLLPVGQGFLDGDLIGAVYLIDQDEYRYFSIVYLLKKLLIFEVFLAYLYHIDKNISILKGIFDKVHHGRLQLVGRLDNTWGIGEDYLEIFPTDDSKNTVPCGLCLGGDDRKPLAYKGVQQSGFPYIWVSDNIYES